MIITILCHIQKLEVDTTFHLTEDIIDCKVPTDF